MKSITFYLTIAVIRFLGIKKNFTPETMNDLVLRKDDIHTPKNKFFKSFQTQIYTIKETKITEIKKENHSPKLLMFIHGGAFVSGPSKFHWDSLKKIAKMTRYTVWMCDYPKAPEHKISQISANIDAVYQLATEKFNTNNIVIMGDSAGGALSMALIQRLILSKNKLPSQLILISPVLDASYENPNIDVIDKKDPILSKKGLIRASEMCVEDGDLKNLDLSPLFGSFIGFPTTTLFMAENDVTYPDQLLLCKKLEQAKITHSVISGMGMPHDWPLIPVMKEAKTAFHKIVEILNN